MKIRAAWLMGVLVIASLVGVSSVAVGAPARTADTVALRGAIEDLVATFGDRYPNGRAYLDRLAGLGKKPDAAAFAKLRREALVANPLVGGQGILFVTRSQYINEHGTEATMYQTGEINTKCFRGGGAIKRLDAATGKVTTILDVPEGIARDPEVHFDGRKIVFSMRRDIADDYHLYEMSIDLQAPGGVALPMQLASWRLSRPGKTPRSKLLRVFHLHRHRASCKDVA